MKKIIPAVLVALVIGSFFSFQKPFDLKSSIARGKEVYGNNCITCHMEKGEGMEDVFPPLAKSDYLMANKKRSIQQIIKGVSGEIKVNGKIYNSDMIAIDLTDQQVSDVLNYVRNSFGNKGEAVTVEQVKAERK
ncbi:MAG: cytochrome c [Cyclobacteriaceae bacterium]|nr:cytochrome c [Cyclobacteriaceae bacterium]